MLYTNIVSQYMAQLSIALDAHTEKEIAEAIARGDFQNKSELVKKAIASYMRELAYQRVLQSEREFSEGNYFTLKGSLKEHLRKTKI